MAQDFLIGNIKGQKGDPGATGATGAPGPQGEPGPQGPIGPANTSFISDAFDSSKAYSVGDYFIKDNTLMKVIEGFSAGGFNDDKVMSTLIGTELSGLNSNKIQYYFGKSDKNCDTLYKGITYCDVNYNNCPESYCFILTLCNNETAESYSDVVQIAFPISNTIIYRRRKNGNVWTNWTYVNIENVKS